MSAGLINQLIHQLRVTRCYTRNGAMVRPFVNLEYIAHTSVHPNSLTIYM